MKIIQTPTYALHKGIQDNRVGGIVCRNDNVVRRLCRGSSRRRRYLHRSLSAIIIMFVSVAAFGQDTLPRISVKLAGNKAVVSWFNPYEEVTSITIQRSGDSVKNFKSIGSVLNAQTAINGFLDQKEFLPNDQYYRLFITFKGGGYEFTRPFQPVIDTSHKSLVIEKIIEDSEKVKEPEKVVIPPRPTRFKQSKYVYYVYNDQNVVVSLPQAGHKKYKIKFFEDDGAFLFELSNLPKKKLILDRINFNHHGLFRFELYDNNSLIENHKLFIPEPNKRIPPLDADGHAIR